MQAIHGLYDNGALKLERKAPAVKARVLVVFEVEEPENKIFAAEVPAVLPQKTEDVKGTEALARFEKYRGRITREIDIKKERDEYLNEKYGVN